MAQLKWLRILAIVPSSAMIFMDQSILPVALPVIQEEFGASNVSLQWAVNAYLLSWSIFVLLAGKIGDRIGHRINYFWGILLFALFSALCGLSPNVGFLIVARFLQGIAGAIMIPSQTSLLAMSFPPQARGRATGIIVSIGSTFLVLGPLIGGLLTDWLSWRWIFWVNLPIAAFGMSCIFKLLPKLEGRPVPIDWIGFLYFAIFSSLATVSFMQGNSWGWSNAETLFCFFIAASALVFAIIREKKVAHPFLELNLFKRPIFAAVNVSVSLVQFVLMITVFRTIYTETILGYTPVQAGMLASFSSLPLLFFAYVGGFLSDKISPKFPIFLGHLFLIASFFWLGIFPTPSLKMYLPPLFLFGMGLPLILTPSYSMAMNDIPKEKMGIAFGMLSTLRMFAGTTGLALIFVFVSVEQMIYAPKVGEKEAEIISFSSVHFLLGVLMVLVGVASLFLHRRKSAHRLPDAPAEGWD